MKRLTALLLAVMAVLALCGCGGQNGETSAATEGTEPPVFVETTLPEVPQTTAAPTVYAEELFQVEDIVYEIRRDELKNFEIKIRNLTDEKILDLYFRVQALDTQGDVLAAWTMGAQDGLEPGQAYWYYCSNALFDDCRNMEEAALRADAIRITYVKIQTVRDDPSSWVEYDFASLPTFRLADIRPKG